MTAYTVRVQGTDSQGHPASVDLPITVTSAEVKPLMGASTSSNSTWTTLQAAVGAFESRRTYGSTIPASYSGTQSGSAGDIAAGRFAAWSFKPNQATFPTDTMAHNQLRTMLRTVPLKAVFTDPWWLIIDYHEPEDNIAASAFTLPQWKATVQKVGEIVAEIRAEQGPMSRLRNGICLMGPWTFDTRSNYDTWDWTFTPAQLAVIDYVCFDPYRWNPGDPAMETILTRNESGTGAGTDRSVMAKVLAWGKPVVLSEWGCTSTGVTDANRAAWINATWTWFKTWNVAHPTVPFESVMYFHNNLDVPNEPRATWEVLASGQDQSKQALIDILADAKI